MRKPSGLIETNEKCACKLETGNEFELFGVFVKKIWQRLAYGQDSHVSTIFGEMMGGWASRTDPDRLDEMSLKSKVPVDVGLSAKAMLGRIQYPNESSCESNR